jgi:hypothetical protein
MVFDKSPFERRDDCNQMGEPNEPQHECQADQGHRKYKGRKLSGLFHL